MRAPACTLLALFVLQGSAPPRSDVAHELDRLMARTDALESFYARYRVKVLAQDEESKDGWLELAYAASDQGAVRLHAGETEFQALLVHGGIYTFVPEQDGSPVWKHASFRKEDEACAALEVLDERFPAPELSADRNEPGMMFGLAWNGMEGVEGFRLDLRFFPSSRRGLLDWLPRMKHQADEMTIEGDELLWSGDGFACRLSLGTGFPTRLSAARENGRLELELAELLLDETPASDPFELSPAARAAPEDPGLASMDPRGPQVGRARIFARVCWLLHRGKRSWDAATRADWEAVLQVLHGEMLAVQYAGLRSKLEAETDRLAKRLGDERRRDPPPERSKLEADLRHLREPLVNLLDQAAEGYLASIPHGFGPCDEGMPPEELFEAEREAAGRAFDAHLREPILAAFDEKTSAALDD